MIARAYIDPLTGKWVSETHYAITAQFVRTYLRNFSANSFVYIDACSSDDPRPNPQTFLGAQDFKQAMFDAGASVYAGWTANAGDSIAADSARLVFDRLLGANKFFPEMLKTPSGETFNQRPFPWPSVVVDLPLHGLGADTNPTALLNFTPNPDFNGVGTSVFGLLAPSIGTVAVIENGAYVIPGQSALSFEPTSVFGSDPGSVTVTVDGQSAGAAFGSLTLFNFPTPGVGAGSAGDVIVTVRNHHSNVARLTEWQGTFTGNMPGPGGTLSATLTLNLAFRADIREWRPVIHQPPVEPSTLFPIWTMVPGSSGQFACTGTAVAQNDVYDPNGTSYYQWSGSGNLTPANGATSPPNLLYISGTLNGNTAMYMGFAIGALCTANVAGGFGSSSIGIDPWSGNAALKLDPKTATIQPGIMPSTNICMPGPAYLACTAAVQWGSISPVASPNTAPDKSSAR